jgi:hypothetical protein
MTNLPKHLRKLPALFDEVPFHKDEPRYAYFCLYCKMITVEPETHKHEETAEE